MLKRDKEPFRPVERKETIRQNIISLLQRGTLSAKEITVGVKASEKEVYEHLEHIQKKKGNRLSITPAKCRKCGFVFKKRQKLKKPGKCPVCRGELIQDPLFSIKK